MQQQVLACECPRCAHSLEKKKKDKNMKNVILIHLGLATALVLGIWWACTISDVGSSSAQAQATPEEIQLLRRQVDALERLTRATETYSRRDSISMDQLVVELQRIRQRQERCSCP
jgi:hypothetical protein